MTREEAIRILETGGWWDMLDPNGSDADLDPLDEAIDMAIAALRAQPAKLGRSRWKGCEHCTAEWDYNDYRKWTEGELGEIRISKDELNIDVGPYWETVKIKFCPFCGRPLTEEAWARWGHRSIWSDRG